MASEASKVLEALERDIGAVGGAAAVLRLAARLAGLSPTSSARSWTATGT